MSDLSKEEEALHAKYRAMLKKQEDGSYRLFGKNEDGAMAMCHVPSWVSSHLVTSLLLNMEPDWVVQGSPPPKPTKTKKPKRKPDAVENGGE